MDPLEDGQEAPQARADAVGEEWTSAQKVAAVWAHLHLDRRTAAVLAALKIAARVGGVRDLAGGLPPLTDAEGWDDRLGLAIGVCLSLLSDSHPARELEDPQVAAAAWEALRDRGDAFVDALFAAGAGE